MTQICAKSHSWQLQKCRKLHCVELFVHEEAQNRPWRLMKMAPKGCKMHFSDVWGKQTCGYVIFYFCTEAQLTNWQLVFLEDSVETQMNCLECSKWKRDWTQSWKALTIISRVACIAKILQLFDFVCSSILGLMRWLAIGLLQLTPN